MSQETLKTILGSPLDEPTLEEIDSLTNDIMDAVREACDFNSDSNLDDWLYTTVHSLVKQAWSRRST